MFTNARNAEPQQHGLHWTFIVFRRLTAPVIGVATRAGDTVEHRAEAVKALDRCRCLHPVGVEQPVAKRERSLMLARAAGVLEFESFFRREWSGSVTAKVWCYRDCKQPITQFSILRADMCRREQDNECNGPPNAHQTLGDKNQDAKLRSNIGKASGKNLQRDHQFFGCRSF